MAASGSHPARVFVSHATAEFEAARGLVDALIRILRLGEGEVEMTSRADSSLSVSGIRGRFLPAAEARVLIVIASGANPFGGGELLTQGAREVPASPDRQPFRVLVGAGGFDPSGLPPELGALPFVDGSNALALEDLVGQLAGELGVSATLDMGAHRRLLSQVAHGLRAKRPKPSPLRIGLYLALALSTVALAFVVVRRLSRPTAPDPSDRFGFEHDADGWVALGSDQGGGCVAVRRSDEEAKTGQYSLELDMVLEPSRESRRSGEAAWDASVAATVASGEKTARPIDLHGKEVSLWVYAASGAEGERESPNGIQLFVKDGEWRSQYSAWTNIESERWVQLTLAPGSPGSGGHMDAKLDTSAIRLVGVKMSLGDRGQLPFEGPVFVDAVTW